VLKAARGTLPNHRLLEAAHGTLPKHRPLEAAHGTLPKEVLKGCTTMLEALLTNATNATDDDASGAATYVDDWSRHRSEQGEERVSDYQIFYSVGTTILFLMMVCPVIYYTWTGCGKHWAKRAVRELRHPRSRADIAPSPAAAAEDAVAESVAAAAARVAAAAIRSQSVRRRDVRDGDLPSFAREQTECSVCLGALDDDTAVVLHCGHAFDPECLEAWFGSCARVADKEAGFLVNPRLTCPLCKQATRTPTFGLAASPNRPPRPPARDRSRPSRVCRV